MANPTVAQTLPVTLAAADASGAAVDLVAFPTALTAIAYTADSVNATLTPNATGTEVSVAVAAAGTVVLTVVGTNTAGTVVTASLSLVFDAAVPVVVTVSLTAGTPTP